MKPEYCPFCGGKQLEELEPTIVMMDDNKWTIHHYECDFCTEVFDKIIPEGEEQWYEMTPEDIDEIIGGEEHEEGYEH